MTPLKVVQQAARCSTRARLRCRRCRRLLTVLVVCAAIFVISTFWPISSSNKQIAMTHRTVATNRTHSDVTTRRHQREHPPMNTTDSRLFRHKPLVIWSSNFHPTPVVDIKQLLEPLGVRFIVKDLSSKYCEHFNTCSSDSEPPLRVINKDNVLAMTDYQRLIPEFYAAYRDDPEMRSVDAFLCCDPPGACELFEPFNKSLLIVATTRYNIGRSNAPRWKELNEKIINIASRRSNIVAANNRYDQEYIRYFTGIDAQLLPSTCDYTAANYTPTRPGFLLAIRPRDPQHFQRRFLGEFSDASSRLGLDVRLVPVRQLYKDYRYADLAAHRGIVHLPYQVSVMAVLEQYRMNVPLFFPSKQLLVDWHRRWFVLHERSESPPPPVHFVRRPRRRSNVPAYRTQADRPDPNNDRSDDAVSYWLQYADYYTLPHIVYFDSPQHLASILNTTTDKQLVDISRAMADYNVRSRDEVLVKWKTNLLTIAKYSTNQPH